MSEIKGAYFLGVGGMGALIIRILRYTHYLIHVLINPLAPVRFLS